MPQGPGTYGNKVGRPSKKSGMKKPKNKKTVSAMGGGYMSVGKKPSKTKR